MERVRETERKDIRTDTQSTYSAVASPHTRRRPHVALTEIAAQSLLDPVPNLPPAAVMAMKKAMKAKKAAAPAPKAMKARK